MRSGCQHHWVLVRTLAGLQKAISMRCPCMRMRDGGRIGERDRGRESGGEREKEGREKERENRREKEREMEGG